MREKTGYCALATGRMSIELVGKKRGQIICILNEPVDSSPKKISRLTAYHILCFALSFRANDHNEVLQKNLFEPSGGQGSEHGIITSSKNCRRTA